MESGISVDKNADKNSRAAHWLLDLEVVFLNHGSFGACPIEVLKTQSELRARLERQPVHFFVHDFEPLLDAARQEIADFVGADAEDLALCSNATTAVNSVLSSLRFQPDDELLCTDQGYNACGNVLARTAERSGARVVRAHIPFPISGADEVIAAVLGAVTPRTRLVLIDHVTSPTGLIFPVAAIVAALKDRGIETMVDGAHAPGMLPLDLRALGAAYYTGNLHKWCCAPKGAAFLFVRRELQQNIHPAVTSHGKNATRKDRSRFLLEFDWVGSDDYSAILSAPAALRFMSSLLPGGFPTLMQKNRQKALAARRILADALHVALPCPDDMIGALAALPVPALSPERLAELTALRPKSGPTSELDPLQMALYARHRIEVPVIPFPAVPGGRLVRISAQYYNHLSQYEKLASALTELVFS